VLRILFGHHFEDLGRSDAAELERNCDKERNLVVVLALQLFKSGPEFDLLVPVYQVSTDLR
jgi:hypothetical protein